MRVLRIRQVNALAGRPCTAGKIMLNYHKPDLAIFFAPVIDESPVVKDMLKRAEKKGIRIWAVDRETPDSGN